LLAKADLQGAETVLLESLKINDSPVANRMLERSMPATTIIRKQSFG